MNVTKEQALEAVKSTERALKLLIKADEFVQLSTIRAFIEQAGKDAERLDSGCITTHDRDEFGTDYRTLRTGLDMRAAIDQAIASQRGG